MSNRHKSRLEAVESNHAGSSLTPPGSGQSRSRSRSRKGAVLIYDQTTSEWFYPDGSRESRIISNAPSQARLYRHAGCVHDRFVYLSADASELTKDMKADSWAISGKLTTARRNHCAFVVAPGRLYVFGGNVGHDEDGLIGRVEWLDIHGESDDVFHPMPDQAKSTPIRTKIVGSAIVQTAYISGGIDAFGRTSTDFHVYDAPSDRWFPARPCRDARLHAAQVSVGKSILLSGGRIDKATGPPTVSCERYDVNSDSWHRVGDMNHCRHSHQMVNSGGRLFVLGGFDENQRKLVSVEEFDPPANKWRIVPKPMLAAHACFSAVAVE